MTARGRKSTSVRGTAGAWRRRAEAVAALVRDDALAGEAMEVVRQAAKRRGGRVAIACSGGADSVALALVLWARLPKMRGRWLMLHFDHRLRGTESAGDARFVRALSRGLGELCVVEAWMRPESTARGGTDSVNEAEARAARMDFFARAMREGRATVLALGHHGDDVAETMLMRLVRGSGTAGLAAPRPVQRMGDGTVRVRPLLDSDARSLRAALQAASVPWREDSSNACDDHLRNRVRHHVLPALRSVSGHGATAGFQAARRLLEEDDAALQQWANALVRTAGNGGRCDVSMLQTVPRAVVRRVVHAWLIGAGLDGVLSRTASEQLIDSVETGREARVSVGQGGWVVFDGLSLNRENAATTGRTDPVRWEPALLRAGETAVCSDGSRLTMRIRKLTPELWRRIRAGEFPASETAFLALGEADRVSLGVRTRRPGDRYRPLGGPGRALLQDMFVNRKIPRPLRDRLPVVCDGRALPVWVPGLPPAAEMAVQPHSKLVVQLTYLPAKAIVSRLISPLSQHHVRT